MALNAGDIVFDIKADDSELRKALEQTKTAFAGTSKAIGAAMTAVGAAITGAVGAIGYQALSAAEEVDAATMKMVAALGLPAEEAERFRKMIREVYGNNFGDSLTDVGEAIQTVALGLQDVGVRGSQEIATATESAFMLRDAYGIEIAESINAVSGLMQNFGVTSDEAFNFVTAGMQRGMDASGDFLESIGEYSTQFADGGATAAQFLSVMESGMQSGMLGTDKAADSFKEFRVRLLDGSKSTAEAMALIGLNIDEITAQINAGALTTAGAWEMVIHKLSGVTDQAVLLQAGVGLLGTQFEDLGAKTVLSMTMSKTSLDGMAEATQRLSEQYKTLANDWEGVKRKMVLAAESMGQAIAPALGRILDAVAPLIERFAAWVEKNPQLAASLGMVAGALGMVAGAVGSVMMILPKLKTGFEIVKVAVIAVGAAFTGLGATIGAPVVIIGLAIANIILWGWGLVKNWESIKGALAKIWQGIAEAFKLIFAPLFYAWEKMEGMWLDAERQARFGGGPQYAMAGPGGGAGGAQFASAGPRGGSGGGGHTFNFSIYTQATNGTELSRTLADQIALELRARGV